MKIIANNKTFPHQNGGNLSEKYRFLIVNYKKLQVFRSDNIKIRSQHIKIYLTTLLEPQYK